MNSPKTRVMYRAFLLSFSGLLILSALGAMHGSREARSTPLSATYARGRLSVAIRYRAEVTGAGRLRLEVLDPEDRVIASAVRDARASSGGGTWLEQIRLERPLPLEDLVWHRLRYRFEYQSGEAPGLEGTESISQILRTPVIHIIGQQAYVSGSQAAVRVVATDSRNEVIPGGGLLRIDLLVSDEKPHLLYQGQLNRRGTAEAQFQLPRGLAGAFSLRYTVDTAIGSTDFTEPVRVEEAQSIFLTTEKPIYQPGQTVHLRALVLDRISHQALDHGKLTFEVEDSRGNKVFKKFTSTDEFGIAFAEFALADEVNLGTYHIRAIVGQADSAAANTAERAIQVERYVLPKFKVAVEFDPERGKPKRGYRPGELAAGKVQADYFFGKPVEHGEVTVKALGLDVTQFEAGSVSGKTDADGVFRFAIRLPEYFAGRPLEGGAARLLIEATVKDAAGHSETRGEPITVTEAPILISVVPEGGSLVRGLENEIFVITSYPDGTPAKAELRIRPRSGKGQTISTDEGGVAILRITPGAAAERLEIEAQDEAGNHAQRALDLQIRDGQDQVLLRIDRALHRVGDRVRLQVFSTRRRGTVYVDAIKAGQTILTRDLDLEGGRAELSLPATPELAGNVDINAYLFSRDAQPVGDHRLIFVQPADDLHIEVTPDGSVYRPGDEARILFRVTGRQGEGVRAALGLEVVDEAVFALAEKQPGLAKVFFYLEQEVLKPRYELHSIQASEVLEPTEKVSLERRELAARALFAATEIARVNRLETEFGRTIPSTKYDEYSRRYRTQFLGRAKALAARLNADGIVWARNRRLSEVVNELLRRGELDEAQLRDAWGSSLRFEPSTWDSNRTYEVLISAGPDKVFGTGDDLAVMLEVRRLRVASGRRSSIVTVSDRFGMFRDGILARAALADGRGGIRAGMGGGVGMGMAVPKAMFERRLHEAAEEGLPAPAPMNTASVAKGESPASPRVRSYFPEALYINPEIITDRQGRASILIRLADSITTWRMAMSASTPTGALGSANSSLKVFQDFFVDLDLPVTLTQGDRVSIPVAIHNYSGSPGIVDMEVKPDNWYSLEKDEARKTVPLEGEGTAGSQFSLTALRIGKFKLTLSARMEGGAPRADIVVREIEVVPNGREQDLVFNGRLEGSVRHEVRFPAAAIPEASEILVKLYPGPLSQVIEGMDSILQMPGGCFEQTSSSTYPDVLALDYMKRVKKLTPEIHAKAEGFISNGYQRLLTFEVPGGGFSWFGNPPANKILTAYGLMEFFDMSKVHDVDPNVIARTQAWLAGQQLEDGSWKPDREFINEGATNRYNSDVLRITAYLAWALESSGYRGPAVERAKQFIERHLDGKLDAYTLAVLANFAVDYGKDRDFAREAVALLLQARVETTDQVYWRSEETAVYATGESASIETTGLATQALLKWGATPEVARKALQYLTAKKDARGNWGTTQATIMALRALLLATEKGSADVRGAVEVLVNGKPARRLDLTEENNDLLHQLIFRDIEESGPNTVEIRFQGKGGLAYQVVGRYFLPWDEKPDLEPMTIDVAYDRTRLAQGDLAEATVKVRNNLPKSANMVMVDLGIPPGFDLLAEDLESAREKTAAQKTGHLEKFSLTSTQAILYFDSFAPGQTVVLKYRLRAKYPIRARTFSSRVYQYYDPGVQSVARPIELVVQ